MKRIVTVGMIAGAAWLITGCADEPGADLDERPFGADTAALDTTAAGDAARPMDAGAGVALGIDSLPELGAYLTDGEGRALYLLEGESADTVTCRDACAEEWPPVVAGEAIVNVAPGIQESLVGTIDRGDGSMQVTYAGRPLYYYHDDQGPGDTTGHAVTDQWGAWYLVTPAGEAVRAGAPAGGSAGA